MEDPLMFSFKRNENGQIRNKNIHTHIIRNCIRIQILTCNVNLSQNSSLIALLVFSVEIYRIRMYSTHVKIIK